MSFEDDYRPEQNLLFHFTNRKSCIESILPSRCLKFSFRKHFDDIAESTQVNILGVGSYGDSTEDQNGKIAISVNHLQDSINNNIQVLCFCKNTNNFIPSFILKPRMWSQYSRGQEGICLIFDEDKLDKNINSQLDKRYLLKDDITYKPYPIYRDELEIQVEDLLDLHSEEDMLKLITKVASGICFQKNEDYISENEKRYVYLKEGIQQSVSYKDSLIGIVLGSDFPNFLDPLIQYYKKENGLNIYRLGICNGRPYLVKQES